MKLPEWEQSFGRLVAGALQRGAEIRLGNLFFGKKNCESFCLWYAAQTCVQTQERGSHLAFGESLHVSDAAKDQVFRATSGPSRRPGDSEHNPQRIIGGARSCDPP